MFLLQIQRRQLESVAEDEARAGRRRVTAVVPGRRVRVAKPGGLRRRSRAHQTSAAAAQQQLRLQRQ